MSESDRTVASVRFKVVERSFKEHSSEGGVLRATKPGVVAFNLSLVDHSPRLSSLLAVDFRSAVTAIAPTGVGTTTST